MVTNLVNLFSQALSPRQVQAKPVQIATSSNPFANPFMGTQKNNNDFYGKNSPVKGGYFAGYYNGQPNIVGKRLFVEA